jgi:hypothetical protein
MWGDMKKEFNLRKSINLWEKYNVFFN